MIVLTVFCVAVWVLAMVAVFKTEAENAAVPMYYNY